MNIQSLLLTAYLLALPVARAADVATAAYKGQDTNSQWAVFAVSNQSAAIIAHKREAHAVQVLREGNWIDRGKPYSYDDGKVPSFLFVVPGQSDTLQVLRPPAEGVWRVGIEVVQLTNTLSEAFLRLWRQNPMSVLERDDLLREYVAIQDTYSRSHKLMIWSQPTEKEPNKPIEHTEVPRHDGCKQR